MRAFFVRAGEEERRGSEGGGEERESMEGLEREMGSDGPMGLFISAD